MAGDEAGQNGDSPKWVRPDGRDAEDYKDTIKWTFRRWAWEFLIRNPEFVSDCDRVRLGDESEKKVVAKKYGLKRFKSYDEPWGIKEKRPRFFSEPTKRLTNLTRKSKWLEVVVGPGKLLFMFDLGAVARGTITARRAIDEAIDAFEKGLEGYRTKNPGLNGEAKDSDHIERTALNFGVFLRILDCVENPGSKMTNRESQGLIYTNFDSDPSYDPNIERDWNRHRANALKFVRERYLEIAIRGGKPREAMNISIRRTAEENDVEME